MLPMSSILYKSVSDGDDTGPIQDHTVECLNGVPCTDSSSMNVCASGGAGPTFLVKWICWALLETSLELRAPPDHVPGSLADDTHRHDHIVFRFNFSDIVVGDKVVRPMMKTLCLSLRMGISRLSVPPWSSDNLGSDVSVADLVPSSTPPVAEVARSLVMAQKQCSLPSSMALCTSRRMARS